MTDRQLPGEQGVVRERPDAGGGAATPSFRLPDGASPGLPGAPVPLAIGPTMFAWGQRTYIMGIVNVTPDSFSGDGLLRGADRAQGADAGVAAADPVQAALAQAQAMVAEGADLLDVGGASSRPGHAPIPAEEEIARVVPVVRAIAQALPGTVISVDTTSPSVAEAALTAGAHLVNDVWGVADDDGLMRVAAEHRVPIVLMHNRDAARYRNLMAEVVADLWRALDRALDAGVLWEHLVIDPGFGFGKTPEHNLALLAGLDELRVLRRPLLLGTSRKSTLGKLLDLPPGERVEVTAASTVLGVVAGADIVRVHDVAANVRAARVADAVRRGWRPAGWITGSDA